MKKTEIAKELYKCSSLHGLIPTLHTTFDNNIHVSIAFTKSSCDESVDAIEFSVRSSNALKRSGCMTIGDVVDAITNDELVHIRNLGKKSLSEIKTRILQFGYEHLNEKEKLDFFIDIVERNCK